MRVDKYLCACTGLSRSQAHQLIRQGQVTLNGLPLRQTAFKLGDDAHTLLLNGQPLQLTPPGYWMLYKPAGVVCANTDSQHPTVIDILRPQINPAYSPCTLQICGRLDKDTTGLVLVTTEGDWNHRVTAPKKQVFKRYLVTTAEPLNPQTLRHLAEGVMLQGETAPTLPALVQPVNSHQVYLSICEGKYHQIKRMLAAVGNAVTGLHRESIGDITLDATLTSGGVRSLYPHEIAGF